ncbi:hypothetical protein BGW80DRAFT_588087 [Lactifluus volemus]|nr:hypothetical protein BGW80DRAFT_588087 [Lactifluus volemus]
MTITYPSSGSDSLIIICLSIYVGHLLFAFRTWCHFLAMCLLTSLFFIFVGMLELEVATSVTCPLQSADDTPATPHD